MNVFCIPMSGLSVARTCKVDSYLTCDTQCEGMPVEKFASCMCQSSYN